MVTVMNYVTLRVRISTVIHKNGLSHKTGFQESEIMAL